jgi:hypothetical protein
VRQWRTKKISIELMNSKLEDASHLIAEPDLLVVASITVRWILCLLALTQPSFSILFYRKNLTAIRHPFYFLMATITEGLFLTQSTGTPGIVLAGFKLNTTGLCCRYLGEAFIGNHIFHNVFLIFCLDDLTDKEP